MLFPGLEFSMFLIVDGLLSIITGAIVYLKDREYVLNKLTALALLFFGTFFLSESFIYIIAPLKVDNLFLYLNLFRDLTFLSAYLAVITLFYASSYIHRGENYVKNPLLLAVVVMTSIVGLVLAIFLDNVTITGEEILLQSEILASIGIFAIPVLFVFVSMVEFWSVARKTDVPAIRFKIMLVVLGLALILAGQGYYAIVETLGMRRNVLFFVGHIFYFLADCVILYAFAKPQKN